MDASIHRLVENERLVFVGDGIRNRPEISAARARRLLAAHNPHGKPNSDVLRPWVGAADIVRAPRNRWTVDFLPGLDEREASLYELPYAEIRRRAQPARGHRCRVWLRHNASQVEMRVALAKRDRFLVTPAAGRHRLFVWLPSETLPDRSLIVLARDDDWFFGILHSRWHRVWARRLAPRRRSTTPCYTPAVLETFPFPWPPSTPLGKLTRSQDDRRTAVALAAATLHAQRSAWLGDDSAPRQTLTALYDSSPPWLLQVHAALDEAVAAAYGWEPDLSDDETFSRLLVLNQERSPLPTAIRPSSADEQELVNQ